MHRCIFAMKPSSSAVRPVFRRLVGNRSLYTTTTRYAGRRSRMSERSQQVWDSSRGIAFSGEGRESFGVSRLGGRGYATSFEIRQAEAGVTETGTVERATFEEGPVVVESKVEVVVEKAESVAVKTENGQQNTENGDEKAKDDITTPPYTPLDFKIPENIFLTAKKAPEGSPQSFWSYQMYRGPTGKERVKVHYCVSPETTERVIQRYFLNEPLLGFDLEWAADALPFHGARRNVSLIQIASPTRIALFHVALYPRKGPQRGGRAGEADSLSSPLLKKILEDPNVTKVGVWVVGDANRVQKHLKMTPRGIFELSHLYKLVKYCESGEHSLINKRLVSLGKLAEEVLKLPLYKELDVRASDWTKSLKLDQIIYSASDAYAGVQIYSMLNHQRLQLDPCPPLPHHAELKLPIELPDHTVLPASTEADEIEMTPAEAVEETEPKAKKTKAPPAPKREKHPLFAEADLWASQYRLSHPYPDDKPAAKHYELRLYYLWHKNTDLDIDAIRALPRDPPLALHTAISYILRAIRREKLPYDKKRMIEALETHQRSFPPGAYISEEKFLERLKKEVEKGKPVLKEPKEGGVVLDGPTAQQQEKIEQDAIGRAETGEEVIREQE